MNVGSILNYEKDPSEDFYSILGCDPESSTEQIVTEFKVRAKELHPDKCTDGQPLENQEKFKQLLEAKNLLIDPERRRRYDAWRNSGIAISFKQWIGFKDSVQASMHWVVPKTAGRMLQSDNLLVERENDMVSLKTSPVTERDLESGYPEAEEGELEEVETDADDIVYDALPYDELGLRIETPPPEHEPKKISQNSNDVGEDRATVKKPPMLKTKSMSRDSTSGPEDAKTAMRRKLFAIRRESTIGTMVMAEKLDDNEIRRKFRNYEI